MRRFNAGKFLVVCCFCLSYCFDDVFGSSTVAKRDVAGVSDAPNSTDGQNSNGGIVEDDSYGVGLNGLDGSNTTDGEAPVGSLLPNEVSDASQNATSNGTGSDFNSTSSLSSFGDLGSNSTSDLGSDIDSNNKNNQTEGSTNENIDSYRDNDESTNNSTEDTEDERTKSNSTDFSSNSDLTDDEKYDQTNLSDHTNPPGNEKNTTSAFGDLLGGLFDKIGKHSNQTIPYSSGLDDSRDWPNDQGWDHADFTNGTKTSTSDDSSPADILRVGESNSSQSQNFSSPSSNYTSDESSSSSPSPISSSESPISSSESPISSSASPISSSPPPISSSQSPISSSPSPISSASPPPDIAAKYSTAYWIPIFNFENDFYFLTHKGYAKLVNFPAPVIYSFTPVPLGQTTPDSSEPTIGQPRRGEESFSGDFFDSDSSSFADCYVNTNMGNLIPYSYFGSWVAVVSLENGWNLQTYDGYVPLDMYGQQAPVAYEFIPNVYQLSTSTPPTPVEDVLEVSGSSQPFDFGLASWGPHTDGGLATWSEPVVVED